MTPPKLPTPDKKVPRAAHARQAYRLRKGGVYAGDLGEGRGPFISRYDSALGYVWLEHVRFTSRATRFENPIAEILKPRRGIIEIVNALREAGFELEEAPYEELFDEPEEAPQHAPPIDDDLRAIEKAERKEGGR